MIKIKKLISKNQSLRLLLLFAIFMQFPFHTRVGDDWPNSQFIKYLEWRYGQLTPELFFGMIWSGINDWMTGQGRFFPMAALQSQITLFLFKNDLELSVFYGVFICLTLYLWSLVLDEITQLKKSGNLFVLLCLIFIRFRSNFEPHIGFTQLVIWSFFWASLALLLVLKSCSAKDNLRKLYVLSSGLIFLVALCQYELAILFLPSILILIGTRIDFHWEKNKIEKFLQTSGPILISTSLYLFFVFAILRPRANPTGNYVTGFDLLESLKMIWVTIFAGLPLFGMNFRELFLLPNNAQYLLVVIMIISITYLSFQIGFTNKHRLKKVFKVNSYQISNKERKISLNLIKWHCISMSPLILGPSLILSIQPNWWGYFKFGQSYLGVFYAEVGYATILALIMGFFYGKGDDEKSRKSRAK